MKIELFKTVYHKEIYSGLEPMTIVGIRANEVELQGDYSGGTQYVRGESWMPIEGLLEKSLNLSMVQRGNIKK